MSRRILLHCDTWLLLNLETIDRNLYSMEVFLQTKYINARKPVERQYMKNKQHVIF